MSLALLMVLLFVFVLVSFCHISQFAHPFCQISNCDLKLMHTSIVLLVWS